jgi:pimeloyl-ACP methyl ester carboxylesterase
MTSQQSRPSLAIEFLPQQPALDIIALMDALKIEKAVLAGFDWGARTASALAEIKAASRGDLTIGGPRWPPRRCGWTWWAWWSCCGARPSWAAVYRCCRWACAGI